MKRALAAVAFAITTGVTAWAGSVSCSLNGNSLDGCYTQSQIFSNDPVDWMVAFGEASKPPSSGPWVTSNQAVNITLTSPGLLQRADNTAFAWDGSEWTLPDFVAGQSITTFVGHFGAPSTPTSTPRFGDNLVGVVGSSPLTITFSSPVLSAGLRISSKTLSDFTATLQAYDSQNHLLGTYAIVASGLGGACSGLGVLDPNPHPCNDAPLLAFLGDPNNPNLPQIARLIVSTNDPNGLFIDTLYVHDVPEPAAIFLTGGGICLFWRLRRRCANQ